MFRIGYPYQAFIAILHDPEADPGDFSFSVKYVDRNPDEIIALMSEAEREAYYSSKLESVEQKLLDSNTFWIISGSIMVAVLAIIIFSLCLFKQKRKNKATFIPVEKIEEPKVEVQIKTKKKTSAKISSPKKSSSQSSEAVQNKSLLHNISKM